MLANRLDHVGLRAKYHPLTQKLTSGRNGSGNKLSRLRKLFLRAVMHRMMFLQNTPQTDERSETSCDASRHLAVLINHRGELMGVVITTSLSFKVPYLRHISSSLGRLGG